MQSHRLIAEDVIDANLVKCFSPILKVLTFLGCSRISIKGQLVTTPSIIEKIYSLLWIAGVTFSFSYFVLSHYMNYYHKDSTMFVAHLIGSFVQLSSYISSIIYARFCNGESAVNLFVKLQKVDKTLTLNEFQKFKEYQYYWNIICLVIVVTSFECGYVVYATASVEYPILTVFVGIGLLNVYMELILAASLILYLAIRLRFLNKVVKYNFHVKCYYYNASTPITVNEHLIISADNVSNNLDLEKFLMCLKQILKLYNLITEAFSFPVINIATSLFLWALLVLLTVILGLRAELLSTIVIITIVLWFLFYLIILTTLALVSDFFIKQVRETKLLCIHAMSRRFEGPIWKGANSILGTIQFYQPAFSVYGIFTLDKMLPLSLIGIITTNLVVLIQFTVQI